VRPDASVPQATQQQRADLQRRFDQFALSLCQQLVPSDDGANLFFSPLSLALALTITFTGAANETESVLRAVLCLDDLDLDVITSSARAIMHQLVSPTDRAKLLLANSLWTR